MRGSVPHPAPRRRLEKKELNRGRWEIRATKVYRVQDAVDAGFPGARTVIRTYREVWKTRKTGKKDKYGRDVRKLVGKPTKEVAWHVSSLDPDSLSAEELAGIVRTHWYVETYHGKRDNGYHEDAFTRRRELFLHPSKLFRIMVKGGLL